MPRTHYEWLLSLALAWRTLQDPRDSSGPPTPMSRIDAVAGLLGPTDWIPSNDGDYVACMAAVMVLMWLFACAKSHVNLPGFVPNPPAPRLPTSPAAFPPAPL